MSKEYNNRFVFKISTLLIISFWGIFMILKGFALESSSNIYRYLSYFSCFIGGIRLVFDKYKKRELITIFICILVVALRLYNTGNIDLVILLLFIIVFRNVDLTTVAMWSFYLRGSAFITQILLSFAGVMSLGRTFIESQDRLRYSFNYSHPNLTHGEFFQIIAYYLIYKKGKFSIVNYFAIVLADLLLFLMTDSKTGFWSTIIMLAINYFSNSSSVRHALRRVYLFVYPGLAIISIVLSLQFYDISFIRELGTFGSRFQTAFYMLVKYPITLFGNVINYSTDLGYVNFLLSGGAVVFLVFILGHTLLLKTAINQEEWYLVSYVLVLAGYFIMEHYAQSVFYDFSWLYIGQILLGGYNLPDIQKSLNA